MRAGVRGWMSERRVHHAELLHMQSRIPKGNRRQGPTEMRPAGVNELTTRETYCQIVWRSE